MKVDDVCIVGQVETGFEDIGAERKQRSMTLHFLEQDFWPASLRARPGGITSGWSVMRPQPRIAFKNCPIFKTFPN